MKVKIDSSSLVSGHKVRGVGFYTRELIKALKKEKGVELVGSNYDILHIPFFNPFFVSFPWKKESKIVVTIHDLIPLIYPKYYPPGFRGYIRFLLNKYLISRVNAIITDSETSKKDIVRFLGVPENKIYPIYLAPRRTGGVASTALKRKIKERYNLPDKFVLYVGDVNYNKNIHNLVTACEIADIPLVICGKQALDIENLGQDLRVLRGPRDWIRFLFGKPHPELAHYKKLLTHFAKKNVIRLGFVPDSELGVIFNLATIYCQPSFYEGFGLPVLEAFASGTPVVASRTQTLVEVARDAALFVNPKDPKDMAEGIKKVIGSKKLQGELSKKGLARVKEFSWQKTAKETLKVYEKVCS